MEGKLLRHIKRLGYIKRGLSEIANISPTAKEKHANVKGWPISSISWASQKNTVTTEQVMIIEMGRNFRFFEIVEHNCFVGIERSLG